MREKLEKNIIDLQNGNVNSLGIIYDLTSKGVFTFVLPIVKDYSLAEDVMQQTYIKIYENISTYKKGTNARNWILTIAKNIAINEFNKNKKVVNCSFNDDDYVPDGMCSLDESKDTPIIKLANEILSPEDFRIVIMHIVGEYKHREIAEILNIPLGTVTWKYNNALDKLRKEIEKREKDEEKRLGELN